MEEFRRHDAHVLEYIREHHDRGAMDRFGKLGASFTEEDWDAIAMDTDHFAKLPSISTVDAALLFSGFNPDEKQGGVVNGVTAQPVEEVTTHPGLDAYPKVLRAFNSHTEDGRGRNLTAWRDIAKQQGLKYPGWIDVYCVKAEPADTVGTTGRCLPNDAERSGSPKAQWWEIEFDIFEMAQNIGASKRANNNPHSNVVIAAEISSRISSIDQRKGKNRKRPSQSTVRKKLNGWKLAPD